MVSWHLRGGQALPEGVHVPVLLVQRGEDHLLLLRGGEGAFHSLDLRGQTATGGRCGQRTSVVGETVFSVFIPAFVPEESFDSVIPVR